MRNESHRTLAVKAFNKYINEELITQTYHLSDLHEGTFLQEPYDVPCIYVLRLNFDVITDPGILAIPNRLDNKAILYIGGHPSGKKTSRFNTLIDACRKAQQHFLIHGYAVNDQQHAHSVAACMTTNLLSVGFNINDCILELLKIEEGVNELELLIGYQEKFHHLPPWNTQRGGASAFTD